MCSAPMRERRRTGIRSTPLTPWSCPANQVLLVLMLYDNPTQPCVCTYVGYYCSKGIKYPCPPGKSRISATLVIQSYNVCMYVCMYVYILCMRSHTGTFGWRYGMHSAVCGGKVRLHYFSQLVFNKRCNVIVRGWLLLSILSAPAVDRPNLYCMARKATDLRNR